MIVTTTIYHLPSNNWDTMIGAAYVLDAHCHIGYSLASGVEITEAGLLAVLAAHGVDAAMVMPQPHQGLEVVAIHDQIARFAAANPGVIYGMVNLSPRVPEA